MKPDSGGVCMGVDLINYRIAPGLPPGWLDELHTRCNVEVLHHSQLDAPDTIARGAGLNRVRV